VVATCGDGMVCPEFEACDDGYTDPCGTCNQDCSGAGSGATCGDGLVCPEFETCDDGYADACGSCDATCTGAGGGAVCGDGSWCPQLEVCDDGNLDACGSCNASCSGGGIGDPGDISLIATPSTSSGGTDPNGYGPARLNDGHYEGECGTYKFCWIDATTMAGSGYFQYSWAGAQQVRRISIDTMAAGGTPCGSYAGRNLAGGTIQWWNGGAWVTAGTVSGQTNDWSFTFPSPVTTTAIRIYGAYSGSVANPLIFEWDVYSCP
jgi:hypothetical protein